MRIGEELDRLIQKRKSLGEDIDYENEPTIAEMISLLTQNMDLTVDFLKDECTEEQFIWLSEIIDEVVTATKSRAFIEAMRGLCEKYPQTANEYNIGYFVDSATDYLE